MDGHALHIFETISFNFYVDVTCFNSIPDTPVCVVVRLDDLDKILVKGWSNFGAHKLRRIGVTLELECMWEKVRFRLLAEEKSKAFLSNSFAGLSIFTSLSVI